MQGQPKKFKSGLDKAGKFWYTKGVPDDLTDCTAIASVIAPVGEDGTHPARGPVYPSPGQSNQIEPSRYEPPHNQNSTCKTLSRGDPAADGRSVPISPW